MEPLNRHNLPPPNSLLVCVDCEGVEEEIEASSVYVLTRVGRHNRIFVRERTGTEEKGPFNACRFCLHDAPPTAGQRTCECGAHAIKSNLHSSWCRLYEQPR